jgi:hypothetical protein
LTGKYYLKPSFLIYIQRKSNLVKENGNIILSPINKKYLILEKSFGMFSDGKLSSERFMKEKKIEKKLEG